jgi:hypothetical protein
VLTGCGFQPRNRCVGGRAWFAILLVGLEHGRLNPDAVPEKDNGCASDFWVGLCVMIATSKAVITSCDGLTVTIKPRRSQHNANDAKFNAAELGPVSSVTVAYAKITAKQERAGSQCNVRNVRDDLAH